MVLKSYEESRTDGHSSNFCDKFDGKWFPIPSVIRSIRTGIHEPGTDLIYWRHDPASIVDIMLRSFQALYLNTILLGIVPQCGMDGLLRKQRTVDLHLW